MTELRWLISERNDYERKLQFREVTPAHGEGFRWVRKHSTKWQDVPDVIFYKDKVPNG